MWKSDHNEKLLQSNIQYVVLKQPDLLNITLKTYESRFYRCAGYLILSSIYFCPNCFIFEKQTFS